MPAYNCTVIDETGEPVAMHDAAAPFSLTTRIVAPFTSMLKVRGEVQAMTTHASPEQARLYHSDMARTIHELALR